MPELNSPMSVDPGRVVLFTPAEVAAALRVSRRTVYDRIASGELAAVRVGTGPKPPLRIPADSLARVLAPVGL